MASKIFISYSRKDFDVVLAMRNEIQRRTGVLPWMDVSGIETGARFADVIAETIDGCKLLVFVISQHAVNSPWTRKEVLYAHKKRKKIYPVVIDDAVLPSDLDFLLVDLNQVDYCDEVQRENFFSDLERETMGSLDAPDEEDGDARAACSTQPCAAPKASHVVETRPNASTYNIDERGCVDWLSEARQSFAAGRFGDVMAIFRRIAAKGNSDAMIMLSGCLLKGIGCRQPDIVSARFWQRRAKATDADVKLALKALTL